MATPSASRTKIGRHEVLGFIANGGMAELFLGKDPHTLRPVVIKRILPHLARQGNFVAMFIDEARIGSLIKHPNLVEIFELGQVGTDLFLVMEYLAGENLAGLVRRLVGRGERLPYVLAAHIIAQACLGLHAAHTLTDDDGKELQVVHRDVSPQNLFVTYTGELKVLDFGIATAAHRLHHTATGQLKGKVSYMSPEQVRGETLDCRSDIFSLGVVLYELSMQRRLFKRASELMVLKAVTEEPIPRPSRERPDYPRALENICLRALARDPSQRYDTAFDMYLDLAEMIGDVPDLRGELEAEMARLFPDRIAEKRKLLVHVRAGTDVGPLPAAEVDELVDVPQVSQISGTGARAVPIVPTAVVDAPKRRRVWPLLVLLLLLGGGAGGVVYWQMRDDDVVAFVPPPFVPQAIEAPAVEPPPAKPDDIEISVVTEPPGAAIAIDGEVVGVSPLDVKKPRGDRKLHVELRLASYETQSQDIKLDRDQRLVVALVKDKPAVVPAVKTRPVVKPKPKPKEKDDEFHRFD
jgi:serine/threonine-protein kinase